jgi:hypothetical protein
MFIFPFESDEFVLAFSAKFIAKTDTCNALRSKRSTLIELRDPETPISRTRMMDEWSTDEKGKMQMRH